MRYTWMLAAGIVFAGTGLLTTGCGGGEEEALSGEEVSPGKSIRRSLEDTVSDASPRGQDAAQNAIDVEQLVARVKAAMEASQKAPAAAYRQTRNDAWDREETKPDARRGFAGRGWGDPSGEVGTDDRSGMVAALMMAALANQAAQAAPASGYNAYAPSQGYDAYQGYDDYQGYETYTPNNDLYSGNGYYAWDGGIMKGYSREGDNSMYTNWYTDTTVSGNSDAGYISLGDGTSYSWD